MARTGRPPGRWIESATAKVLDKLAVDGGWMTEMGIAMEVDADEARIHHQLYHMQSVGFVESRHKDRNTPVDKAWPPKTRAGIPREWRITEAGIARLDKALEKVA